jgi:hypothetical protein
MPFNSYRSELLVTQLAISQFLRDDIDGTGASEAGIGIDPGLLAASIRGRPDQALEHAKEVVVDAIQVTLGEDPTGSKLPAETECEREEQGSR